MSINLSDIISSGSSKMDFEEFTSSGTWTRPNSDIKVVSFILVGGGGAGSRSSLGTYGGGGGGGGEIVYGSLPTTSNLTITIGDGGAARTGTNVSGYKGDNSIITGGLFDITAYGGQPGIVFYGAYTGNGGAGGTIGINYIKSTYAGGWQYGSDPASGYGGSTIISLNYGLTGFSTNNGLITRVGGAGGGQGSYPTVLTAGDGASSPFAKGGVIRTSVGGGGGGASFEVGGNGGDGGSTPGDTGTKGSGGGGGTNATYAGDGGDGYCIIFWNA